ncbi:MAG: SGNH hydrolase domain-containing protein [Actinomycetota bacterium]
MRRLRRPKIIATLACLLGLAATESSGAATAGPTLQQLQTSIASSVTLVAPPSLVHSIPPLAGMNPGDASISPNRSGCYGATVKTAVPSNAATLCAYGKTTSKTLVLLTGDSQAGMWLPAFDALGKARNWRVIFLAKSGCTPWGNPNPPSSIVFGSVTVANCGSFVSNVKKWAATAHLSSVILAGRAIGKGGFGATLDPSTLLAGMQAETSSFVAAGAKVVILGPIPSFNERTTSLKPSTCLAAVRPLTICELSPGTLVPQVELQATRAAAVVGKVGIVDVTPLFCTAEHCALVVQAPSGNHLVYYDNHHINRFYSAWVATALGTLLSPALN